MSDKDQIREVEHKGNRNSSAANLSDSLEPFVTAADRMICEECGEFIPIDEHGYNYDHNCLDPSVIRNDYAQLISRFFGNLDLPFTAGSVPVAVPKG